MQNKHEGDWKHRHSTESSLPGGGSADAGNSAFSSLHGGAGESWDIPAVIMALQALVNSGTPIIYSDPYVAVRGDDVLVFNESYITSGRYQGDVSLLRKLSDFAGDLDFTGADGAGARPSYDRPTSDKTCVDVDATSIKNALSERRDWSRPGIMFHEALVSDESDSGLGVGVLVSLRVYIGLVAIALLCSIIYYLATYA